MRSTSLAEWYGKSAGSGTWELAAPRAVAFEHAELAPERYARTNAAHMHVAPLAT